MVEPPAWYLLARDRATGEARLFRTDRIARPQVLADLSFRPNLAELHRQWRAQREVSRREAAE
jgi:predicted DNA-binding transcriptional regulator YafY